jgi:hypothetical protein
MTRVTRVCHVHIPKTGGMSLYRALERWATPERSLRFGQGGREDWEALANLTDVRLASLRLVGGHVGYEGFRARLGPGWAYITVVRDPVARVLSQYAFVTSTPEHPWYPEVQAMDIETFVDWYRRQPIASNQQCAMICGQPDARRALETVRQGFALAASLEHMDVLTARLSALLGTPLPTEITNASRRSVPSMDPGSQTRRAIEDFNRSDGELFERIRDLVLVGTLALSRSA